ncbi:MAG: Hint domain-containing protein [Pseudomonadota bacterium]
MGTSSYGAFVISWAQTELDGLEDAPIVSLKIGATWRWSGDMVRIDGPSDVLRLEHSEHDATRRRCAAKLARRLVDAARTGHLEAGSATDEHAQAVDCGFVVTNGIRSFTLTVIEVGPGASPLLLFLDDVPPSDSELWVVHHAMPSGQTDIHRPDPGGVICFTPGTRIATPDGARAVETLCEGDYVLTKDSGAQEVQWVGKRRMSGARLFAMPHLRPVRIRAGAFGIERPDSELLVSPDHRMLVSGPVAQALFNTSEVLVAARDLINGRTIVTDMAVQQVTYVHLLLPCHQVLWANGVETESFHPASAALASLDPEDRARLLAYDRRIEQGADAYGDYARRSLTMSEAALLQREDVA